MTYFKMTPDWFSLQPSIGTFSRVDATGWIVLKATLIQESLDAIRQIVREELHEALLSSGIPSSEETPEQEAREEAEDEHLFEEVMREAFGNHSLRVEKPEKKVESPNPKEDTLEEKAQWINTWLRYHPDYTCKLDFNASYGLFYLVLTHPVISLTDQPKEFYSLGATLEHRLDAVISYFKMLDRMKKEEKPEEKK